MARLIMSAFADECSRNIDEQVSVLSRNDIRYLEPRFINDKNIAELTEQEVRQLKKTLGSISVYSLGSPLGKIGLTEDFKAHMEKARQVYETAQILGAEYVRVFSFYLHEGKSREDCRSEVIDKTGQLIDLAKKWRITLCHENEAKIYGESPKQCQDLLETFGGQMKCVFDMGNFVLGGYSPWPEGYQLLKKYIQYFHIKDARYDGAVVPPGCGEAMIRQVLQAYLKEYRRDTVVTLEPHLLTFDGLSEIAAGTFNNPYVYETKEAAFVDAICRLKKITAECEAL